GELRRRLLPARAAVLPGPSGCAGGDEARAPTRRTVGAQRLQRDRAYAGHPRLRRRLGPPCQPGRLRHKAIGARPGGCRRTAPPRPGGGLRRRDHRYDDADDPLPIGGGLYPRTAGTHPDTEPGAWNGERAAGDIGARDDQRPDGITAGRHGAGWVDLPAGSSPADRTQAAVERTLVLQL